MPELSRGRLGAGLPLAATYIGGGLAVVLVSVTFDSLIPMHISIVARLAMVASFFSLQHMLRNRPSALPFRRLFQTLLAATVGLFTSWYLSPFSERLFAYSTDTPGGIASAKLASCILTVVPVILIAKFFGLRAGDLYLSRGRFRFTLIAGSAGMIVMICLAVLLYEGPALTAARVVRVLPSILVFVFANAFMEELVFRSLFLRQLELGVGGGIACLSTSIVFTAAHLTVGYTPDLLVFLGILFFLAIVWSWLILRSASVIGSTLFHAGADVMIVLSVFLSMSYRAGS